MIFLGVNLHYIDKEDKYKKGIYPVSPKRFSNQLDVLAKNFHFISQKDLLEAVEGNKKLPIRSCLITFDDGLRCQFEKALPILREKNIPAAFFVCSMPYLENKACFIHKVHWLRANLSPKKFQSLIEDKIKKILGRDIGFYLTKVNIQRASTRYRYDDPGEAFLKYLLNLILSIPEREEIIDSIFSSQIKDEKEFVKNIYFSESQLKDLYKLGYLGMHSYDHRPLAILKENELKNNLHKNKSHLESLVNGNIFSVSYPHGSKPEISKKTIEMCKKLGLKLGFTMERSFNTSFKNPLLFARADINDTNVGKHPLFKLDKRSIKIIGKFGKKREMFCKDA